jgi:hypothetical protein
MMTFEEFFFLPFGHFKKLLGTMFEDKEPSLEDECALPVSERDVNEMVQLE